MVRHGAPPLKVESVNNTVYHSLLSYLIWGFVEMIIVSYISV